MRNLKGKNAEDKRNQESSVDMYEDTIVLVALGMIILVGGFHNIDLAWNMSNAPYCIDWNGFVYQDKITLYLWGVKLILFSWLPFVLAIISVLRVKKKIKISTHK